MRLFSKKYLFGALGIVILGVVLFFAFRDKAIVYDLVSIERGTIVQEVSVTGRAVPLEDIELAFETAGRVSRVLKSVGDRVRPGDFIAALDAAELSAQEAEAQASVSAEKARLEELRRGPRPEELRIKETAISQASQDLLNLYAGTPQILNDAHNDADDAVRKQIDDLFQNDEKADPQLSFSASDSQAEGRAEAGRVTASKELNAWRLEINLAYATSNAAMLDDYLSRARGHLVAVIGFLNNTGDALVSAQQVPVATLSSYKTDLATARTNVTSALQTVSSREQAIALQKLAVRRAEDELALTKAGTTVEQIKNQEAKVAQAEANLLSIGAKLAKTWLRSPIEGTVTKQDAKVGAIVSANTLLATVLSENLLEVELFLPEADVAKIAIGNSAKITLDAYGEGVVFTGKVFSLDPAETLIEGVSTYKTTVMFLDADERIKPGMTANVDILAAKKENVVFAPQRSIIVRDGKKYVEVYRNGKKEEREVETGLRGSEGNIEIVSGLEAGEEIIRLP